VPLTPKHPPGRINRKARAFERDIARLRSQGYTCRAIRETLAEAGMEVSLSTVQREAARCRKLCSVGPAQEASSAVAVPKESASSTHASSGLSGDPRSGREIAAAFVSKRVHNPLLRDRSAP
jgi:hypothetical protein